MNQANLNISKKNNFLKFAIIWAALIVVGIGGGIALSVLITPPVVSIPQSVAEKFLFPIYVPTKLPDGYTFSPKDVSPQEEALMFHIKNGNKLISFSQQESPKDMPLNDFYRQHMIEVKSVSDTPFPTVSGRLKDLSEQGTVISVDANGTWLMITGKDVPVEDLEFLARNLKKS